MKKTAGIGAAVLIVALAGAYAGATAYSAGVVQKEYQHAIGRMTQAMPYLKVTEQKFDKGFLTSTHTLSLQLGCDPKTGQPNVLTLRDTIHNGPFPGLSGFAAARIETQVVLPAAAPKALQDWAAGIRPQDIRTVVDFHGGSHTEMNLPAGQYKDEDGRQWVWQALHASLNSDAGLQRSQAQLQWPGFSGTFERGSFKLVNFRSEGQSTRRDGLDGSEQYSATLDAFELHAGPGKSLNLNQIKYNGESAVEKDLMRGKLALTGQGLVQLEEDGAAHKLDKIEVQESMQNLHMPTLNKVFKTFFDANDSCHKAADGEDAGAQARESLRHLMEGLMQLLPYDPSYSVDKIAVQYEGQEGQVAYGVSFKGVSADEVKTPEQARAALMRKVKVQASARLPIPWIEKFVATAEGGDDPQAAHDKVESMLASMVSIGYVKREDPFIATQAVYEDEKILVNDKPFSMADMMH